MYFIMHGDSTYAEIALPVNWMTVVDSALAGRLQMFRRLGEVKATGETKKIGEWSCKEYEVYSWIRYMDIRYDERETTVWVTEYLPLELAVYHEMTAAVGQIRNYSDDLIEEFKKIEGLPIVSEGVIYMKGFSVDTNEELIEMYEADAPAGVYEIPEGYTKKEQLTMQDLRS